MEPAPTFKPIAVTADISSPDEAYQQEQPLPFILAPTVVKSKPKPIVIRVKPKAIVEQPKSEESVAPPKKEEQQKKKDKDEDEISINQVDSSADIDNMLDVEER